MSGTVFKKAAAAAKDSKRQRDGDEDRREIEAEPMGEGLVFEDPFGDEFEEDEIEEEEQSDEEDGEGMDEETMHKIKNQDEEQDQVPAKQVWRPGIDVLPEGEVLEYDPSAYVMYHSLKTEWPCLSMDIVRDNLGEGRQRFPHSMLVVMGSQADRSDKNKLTLLKMSDLNRIHAPADSDSENDDDDDDHEGEEPTLEHINVTHQGGVNRVRNMPQCPGVVATFADTGAAHVYDLSSCVKSMMQKGPRATPPSNPTFTFRGHKDEGFALDWSPVGAGGRLASGDCAGNIHIWDCTSMAGGGGGCVVDEKAYTGHQSSVEDLQWSPSEATVFASCSADKTIKIWDTRGRKGPQLSVSAHEEDVNVISWNRPVSYLLASGSDDGSFKVWDLRCIRNEIPLANFTYHKAPVTSIEWAPHDESLLCVSSADDQVSCWDLSVEADPEQEKADIADGINCYPPQLLFIHQGQHNVKELHFHPQIPGVIVTTAEDGLNVFKPAINADSKASSSSTS